MSVAVHVPGEPECWDSCGTCRSDTLEVVEVLVAVGERVSLYQPLALLEAYKTDLEIVASCSGVVAELLIAVGDAVEPGETVLLLDVD